MDFKKPSILFFIFILLLGVFPHRSFSSNDTSTFLNNTVSNFALLDHEGKFHELYYYSDKKAIVLFVQGNNCPIVRKSIPYLKELQEKYAPQDVVFLMINSNPSENRDLIKEEIRAFSINMPIFEDKSQTVAKALGLTRTAEAILINPPTWQIIYRGALNDIKNYYLQDAIDAVLERKPVAVSSSAVKGCLLSWEDRGRLYEYKKDVAPILIQKCFVCHSPGGVAPWSMNSYEKIMKWAPMIREVIQTKRMPPWHADPYYGQFEKDLFLTPQEVRTLINWIDQGLKKTNGVDPLVTATASIKDRQWPLGQPDLVLTVPQQEISASGPDEFRFIKSDHPIDKDVWIRAIDFRSGNAAVIHHANVLVASPKDKDDADQETEWYKNSGAGMDEGQMIMGYSPGHRPYVLPTNTGLFIPKGSLFEFRIHYIKTGKPETDQTQLGLYFHKKKPAYIHSVDIISNRDIKIPPGAKDYKLTASKTFPKAIMLTAIQPHVHYRGKSMSFTLRYPNGKQEVILSVPHYKFGWQRQYILKHPKFLPAGTAIVVDGAYDNSAQNYANPDPSQEVSYGPTSDHEMFTGVISYFMPDHSEYEHK